MIYAIPTPYSLLNLSTVNPEGSFFLKKISKYIIISICIFISNTLNGQIDCTYVFNNITSPPSNFQPFYKKYLDVSGISIISSELVSDEAFCKAYEIVTVMISELTEAELGNMIFYKAGFAIMDESEVISDIPEYANLDINYPDIPWDSFRGIGGTLNIPLSSCAEEDLLCLDSDTIYVGENIAVHEFAHGIHNLGLATTYPEFNNDLEQIFLSAIFEGLWVDTYASYNYTEYFAEGVQSWFNTNAESLLPNGIHNQVNTRSELKEYDPILYDFIEQYFTAEDWSPNCDSTNISTLSSEKFEAILFPNPTDGSINILTKQSGRYSILIRNILNIVVYKDEVQLEKNEPFFVQLNNLQSGIYYIQMENQKTSQVDTINFMKN